MKFTTKQGWIVEAEKFVWCWYPVLGGGYWQLNVEGPAKKDEVRHEEGYVCLFGEKWTFELLDKNTEIRFPNQDN